MRAALLAGGREDPSLSQVSEAGRRQDIALRRQFAISHRKSSANEFQGEAIMLRAMVSASRKSRMIPSHKIFDSAGIQNRVAL
jgi:hypothetical protein